MGRGVSNPSNKELIDAWLVAQSTTDYNRKFWDTQRLKDRLAEYGAITPDDCAWMVAMVESEWGVSEDTERIADSLGMKRDEYGGVSYLDWREDA